MFRFWLHVHDLVSVDVHARGFLALNHVCLCIDFEQDVLLGTCLLKGLDRLVFETTDAAEQLAVSLASLVFVKVDGRLIIHDVLVFVGVGFANDLAILQSVDWQLEIVEDLVDILHLLGLVLLALIQVIFFLELAQHHVKALLGWSMTSNVDR